jgi:GNAT superfamily N-acetyltransferase
VITYQWEPLGKALREPNINDLLRAHWHELAVHKDDPRMRLDPDYELMYNAEKVGMFKVWTARDRAMNGLLVGYIAFWIRPHVHYKTVRTAVEDLFFMSPNYRRGLVGYKLWATVIPALKEHGVHRIVTHSKLHFEKDRGGLAKVFQRLGFEPMDMLYSRML